jgi:hypothetical protein
MLSYATRAAKRLPRFSHQQRGAPPAHGPSIMDHGSWIRDDGWLNLMQRSHAITGKSLLLNHVAKEEALQQQSSFSFLDDTKPIVLLSTRLLWSERQNIAKSLSMTNHEGKVYTKTLVPSWKSETSSSSLHACPEQPRRIFRGSSH